MNIDIHNHPTIKPFGHACKLLLKNKLEIIPRNLNLTYLQENYPKILKKLVKCSQKSSIWHNDRPNYLLNKLFAEMAFAKYTESNFTDAIEGDTRIVFVSLYPIEKEYLSKTWDEKLFGIPLLKNFVTGISAKRIDFIQSDDYKYFNDLECEYEFLQTLEHFPGKNDATYFITKNKDDLSRITDNNIAVILTIEGANNFYPTKYVNKTHISEVLANINKVKQWPHKVLWVTIAHHFFNGFVSHEKSLISEVLLLGDINQEEGMNQPLSDIPNFTYFTEEGLKVIDALLSTENGQRILIDLKHVDYRGRQQYYEHLKINYSNTVPIVISHAAVGSPDGTMPPWFNPWTINLNNNDIEAICITNGIIGIELDQRILGFYELKDYKKAHHQSFNKIGEKFSLELIWNSIKYVAEKAAYYKNALPAEINFDEPWDILAIGSDYDGVINPINQFPTLVQMPKLRKGLTTLISNYLSDPSCDPVLKSLTSSTPIEIIDKIFYRNARRFLERNF